MTTLELDRIRESVRARTSLPSPDECRRIRDGARLTREELAAAISVSEKTIGRWERAERKPRGANAERYALVLRAIARALDEP